jgi:ComF family protein
LLTLNSLLRNTLICAKEFFFSLITEECCRLCKRALINNVRIVRCRIDDRYESPTAMLHKWDLQGASYSNVLCQDCWEQVLEAEPILGFYQSSNDFSFAIVSGAPYVGNVRTLIHRLKYQKDKMLAKDLTAIVLFAWRMAAIFLDSNDAILVPVPLHWRKRMKRGFNQAELIADELAKTLKIRVRPNALRRVKSTNEQQELEKQARFDNIRGAFQGNPRELKKKVVVLVDDVCTSGATLSECASECLKHGATTVVALTVARTILLKEARNANLRSLKQS